MAGRERKWRGEGEEEEEDYDLKPGASIRGPLYISESLVLSMT